MKGWALGLNAAGGNIGVSSVQLLTPILMGTGLFTLYLAEPGPGGLYLQNAGLMWLLPLAVAVIGASVFMNNLTDARSSVKDQLVIVKRKHTWVMSYIYIGTFGSFIGYSAAFPLLLKTQFPEITVAIAFLGPLVGSRDPPGRRIAGRPDRRGEGDVLELRRDGGGHDRSHVLHRGQKLRRVSGDVPGAVRHHRHRQRLDLPDDPVDLPRGKARRRERRGRIGPARRDKSGRARKRRRARLYRRDRRLRRLSDPARLRRLDRQHRQPAPRTAGLPGILRQLPRADLVVLHAPELPGARAPSLAAARV